MMLLTPSRISIICCSELIKTYESGRNTPATILSKKFNVNIRTLNPALSKMTGAGILRSQVGGSNRGYSLARDPKDITIYEIVKAIQGFNYMKTCVKADADITCQIPDCNDCTLYKTSMAITDMAAEKFKSITLYDVFVGGAAL